MVNPLGRNDAAARGYTLMEITVTLAIFGVFLFIIVTLTSEMRRNEKKWPVNFMSHPEVGGVLARIRRDVFDSKYYPADFLIFQQSPQTLLLYTIESDGSGETILWDFRTKGEVHRKAFKATQLASEWVARGVPNFTFDAMPMPHDEVGVRIRAIDQEGKLAIDEIFVPRPHE